MPSNKAKGGQKKQKERRRRTADKLAALPSWPPLQPLVPASDLKLETLLEDQVLVIRNFFTATLCRKYVQFLSSLPLSTTPITPKDGEAVRVNDRIQFEDPNFARQLWTATALQQLLSGSEQPDNEETLSIAQAQKLWGGDLCGLNDRIHDESNLVDIAGNPPIPARTTWTLLIYLSSPATGCHGGETVFYPENEPGKSSRDQAKDGQPQPLVVGLEVGMALLHKHGKDCLLHEGRVVTHGEKWVIRSDICVRR